MVLVTGMIVSFHRTDYWEFPVAWTGVAQSPPLSSDFALTYSGAVRILQDVQVAAMVGEW